MTSINIQKLMVLSKLYVQEDEISSLEKDIENTMNMIDKIKELDCSNVEALSSVCSEMTLRMRSDILEDKSDYRHCLFNNLTGANSNIANNTGCFIAPRVLK